MKLFKHSATAIAMFVIAAPLIISSAMSAPEFVLDQKENEWRANNVIGLAVKNPKGETIGDINDIVYRSDNSVAAAVIGVGGFLGIAEKNVAVTFASLDFERDKDGSPYVMVDLSKKALKAAPEYKTRNDVNFTTIVKIKASELSEDTRDAARNISEGAKQVYKDVKESEVTKKATEAAKNVAEGAKEAYKDVKDAMTDKTETK